MTDHFQYDVAFSFLAQDELLAIELSDLLQERLRIFIYSKAQERLAGTDGEATLNDVFARQARTVVILYRQEWGTTPWTRIEQTAIRNRAYEEGYAFALFVPLNDPPRVPEWVPKAQLWIGLDRWGIVAAAGVIESAVQRAGGQPRQESAVERADRLKRRLRLEAERAAYQSSLAAVQDADDERRSLNEEIESLVGTITDSSAGFRLRVELRRRQLILYSSGLTVTVAWRQPLSDSLDGSCLLVKFWRGVREVDAHVPQGRVISEWQLTFDRGVTGANGWHEAEQNRLLTSSALADAVVQELIRLIENGKA